MNVHLTGHGRLEMLLHTLRHEAENVMEQIKCMQSTITIIVLFTSLNMQLEFLQHYQRLHAENFCYYYYYWVICE